MPTPVLTKEFSAFQDSCFPECQPRDKPLFSRESDTLSRGISPVDPISAWPTYLLMLTYRRGWESLAPFELSMNKNNSASQAWNDFEEILALVRQWNEWGVIWSFVRQMHILTTWTWPFSSLATLGTSSAPLERKDLKMRQILLTFVKISWYFLVLEHAFCGFKLCQVLKEQAWVFYVWCLFEAEFWAWKFHSQNNSAVSLNKKRTGIELCFLKK